MQNQYSVFDYSTDLNFHDYKVTIESSESYHCNRDNGCKIERLKVIENKLFFVGLLGLILTKKILLFINLPIKYLVISKNCLKKF